MAEIHTLELGLMRNFIRMVRHHRERSAPYGSVTSG